MKLSRDCSSRAHKECSLLGVALEGVVTSPCALQVARILLGHAAKEELELVAGEMYVAGDGLDPRGLALVRPEPWREREQ